MVTYSTTISLLVNFQHRIGQEGNELNSKFNMIQTWPAFTSQISPDFQTSKYFAPICFSANRDSTLQQLKTGLLLLLLLLFCAWLKFVSKLSRLAWLSPLLSLVFHLTGCISLTRTKTYKLFVNLCLHACAVAPIFYWTPCHASQLHRNQFVTIIRGPLMFFLYKWPCYLLCRYVRVFLLAPEACFCNLNRRGPINTVSQPLIKALIEGVGSRHDSQFNPVNG